jgi:sec-independent protein translocase protein TatA
VRKKEKNMLSTFGILDFGAPELVIILVIVLVLFGGKKLPELSRSLGESINEIKGATKGASELHQEIKGQVNEVKANIVGTPTTATATAAPAQPEVTSAPVAIATTPTPTQTVPISNAAMVSNQAVQSSTSETIAVKVN